jgi:hypothetical protein
MKRGRHQFSCSFCGKSQEEVHRLIAGPAVFICNYCVTLCNEIIAEEGRMSPTAQGQERGRIGRCRTLPWWQRLLGRYHQALLQESRSPEPGVLR